MIRHQKNLYIVATLKTTTFYGFDQILPLCNDREPLRKLECWLNLALCLWFFSDLRPSPPYCLSSCSRPGVQLCPDALQPGSLHSRPALIPSAAALPPAAQRPPGTHRLPCPAGLQPGLRGTAPDWVMARTGQHAQPLSSLEQLFRTASLSLELKRQFSSEPRDLSC